MVWFKVDDGLMTSPKVLSIPRRDRVTAVGLWCAAGAWSAGKLRDGFVPAFLISELGSTARIARALVDSGLWHSVEGGFQFHDWSDYQPTREDVTNQRKKNADKLRKWRERNQVTGDDVTGLQNGSNQVSNPAPDPTRPDPTRPSSKGSAVADSPLGGRDDERRRQANDIVSRYRAALKQRRASEPPRSVISALVVQVDSLLSEGYEPGLIAETVLVWNEKGLGAGALPSVLHEVQTPRQKRTTTPGGINWDSAAARALELDGREIA